MDMVERVARALLASESNDEMSWENLGLTTRGAFKRDARAAIAAMREPSRQMRIVGEREMMARHPNLDCFRDPYVDSTWQAMIDAALGGTDAA
ncbi:hypothetical protein ABIC65_001114 [Sphingomonas trueperi]|uniref:hypothetical protein n=1 Tax=Sphingomonas trueperi TaxID=53317 RepID=UPI0033973C81